MVARNVTLATGFSLLRREHRQRRAEQRAADAEAERIDLVGAGDLLRDAQRRERRLLRGSRPS